MVLTIKKFMMFDLIVLTIIAIVVDIVGYFASQTDLKFLYVALSVVVMMIAYIRWDYKALVIPLVIAILHLILYKGGTFVTQMIYVISLFSTSLGMIWFKLVKRDQIKDEALLITGYFLTGYVSLFLIQALASYVSGDVQWVTLLIRHSVNAILGFVIFFMATKQQDLCVNMKAYLLRSIEERKKEEGR